MLWFKKSKTQQLHEKLDQMAKLNEKLNQGVARRAKLKEELLSYSVEYENLAHEVTELRKDLKIG